jgi:hypothetical protein
MKKLLILSGMAVLLALAAGAQTDETAIRKDEHTLNKQEKQLRHERKEDRKEMRRLNRKEVDERAKDQFKSDFGDVSAETWRREAAFDVVDFVKDGVSRSAYYDINYKLVGTTEKKTFEDLPESARMYITK